MADVAGWWDSVEEAVAPEELAPATDELHEWLRVAARRLSAEAAVLDGVDSERAFDEMLERPEAVAAVDRFFSDPAQLRLFVWLASAPSLEQGGEGDGGAAAPAPAARPRLSASGEPPGRYHAAVCLFKAPDGERISEENVGRLVSSVDLGGGVSGLGGMPATLSQLSQLGSALYFPVGADQLCPAEEPGSADAQPAAGQGGSAAEPWSEQWNATAMRRQIGRAARRQVTADFSRFVAEVDVAAEHAAAQHAVCLPLPLCEGKGDDDASQSLSQKLPLADRVRMIERSVDVWSAQIRGVLSMVSAAEGAGGEEGPDEDGSSDEPLLPGPSAELRFWEERLAKLDSIQQQLSSRQLVVCMQVLRAVSSSVYPEFSRLCKQATAERDVAASNCRFLAPLQRFAQQLERGSYSEAPQSIAGLVQLVGLVRQHSEHYRGRERAVRLLRCVASEIIRRGQELVGHELVGAGVRIAEVQSVCRCFCKSVGKGVTGVGLADVSPEAVCGRVKRIMDRCSTLQTVLFDIDSFGKQMHAIEIKTQGDDALPAALALLQSDADAAIERLLTALDGRNALLDLEERTVPVAVDVFRQRVVELDQRLRSFMRSGVDASRDLHDCAAFIDSMRKLAQRKSAEISLRNSVPAIVRKFDHELDQVDRLFSTGGKRNCTGRAAGVNLPPVAGAVMWSRGLSKRIDAARYSFDACLPTNANAEQLQRARHECKLLAEKLASWRAETVNSWRDGLTVSADDLKQSLLIRPPGSNTSAGAEAGSTRGCLRHLQVKVNLSPSVSEFVREMHYLSRVHSLESLPPGLVLLFQNSDDLRQQTESLSSSVRAWNAALSEMDLEESVLLQRQTSEVEMLFAKCLPPGTSEQSTKVPISWRAHGLAALLTRIRSAVRAFRAALDVLQANTHAIGSAISRWCNFNFGRKDPDSPLFAAAELDAEKTTERVEQAVSALRELMRKDCAAILALMKSSAHKVGASTASEAWQRYAQERKRCCEDGLQSAYTSWTQSLSASLAGASEQSGVSIMEVRLELTIGLVSFAPASDGVARGWAGAASEVFQMGINALSGLTRASSDNEPGTPQSERCAASSLIAIEQAEAHARSAREAFVRQFLSHSHLWDASMADELATFMRETGEQARQDAAAADGCIYIPAIFHFHDRIRFYRELASEIAALPGTAAVSFFRVDARPIKQAMTSWAARWSAMYEGCLAKWVTKTVSQQRAFVSSVEPELDLDVRSANDGRLTTVMLAARRVSDAASAIGSTFRPCRDVLRLLSDLGAAMDSDATSRASATENDWRTVLDKAEQVPTKWREQISVRRARIKDACGDWVEQVRAWRQAFDSRAPVSFQLSTASRKRAGDERSLAFLHVGDASYDHRSSLCRRSYRIVAEMHDTLAELAQAAQALEHDSLAFQVQYAIDSELLHDCRRRLLRTKRVWDVCSLVTYTLDGWANEEFFLVDERGLARMATDIAGLCALVETTAPHDEYPCLSTAAQWLHSFCGAVQAVQPLHQSGAVMPRHWKALVGLTSADYAVVASNAMVRYGEEGGGLLRVGDVLSLQPQWSLAACGAVLAKAEGELKLEQQLSRIARVWRDFSFTVVSDDVSADPLGQPSLGAMLHLDRDPLEKAFQYLQEHGTDIAAASMSKFSSFFQTVIQRWLDQFRTLHTALHMWEELDRTMNQLAAWFLVEARVQTELDEETQIFSSLFTTWQQLLIAVRTKPNVLASCTQVDLLTSLEQLVLGAEKCSVALADFVQNLRMDFPRLFFVSKREVLGVLSAGCQSVSAGGPAHPALASRILPFLPKLFDGIQRIEFDEGSPALAVAIVLEGGRLAFAEPLLCAGPLWLQNLLDRSQQALRELLAGTRQATQHSISQVVSVADCATFTMQVEEMFAEMAGGSERALGELRSTQSEALQLLVKQVRQSPAVANGRPKRSVLETLLVRALRNSDLLAGMQTETTASGFLWRSQLRYYLDTSSGEVAVHIMRGVLSYGFEPGVVPPPIYVPLTDRSYVAFAQALHSVSGVALSGPATSGKKAAVSHLGASLGRKMFWLRASEDSCPGQMDLIVQALVGMVGAGVWCCLDSWSWSNGSAAAACAVHLKAVLDGCRAQAEAMTLSGINVQLQWQTAAFFVSRTTPLPDKNATIAEELRTLVRPVSISYPDRQTTATCLLAKAGFAGYSQLAVKIGTLFALAADTFHSSPHDWSLRTLTQVVSLSEAFKPDGDDPRETRAHEQQEQAALVSAFLAVVCAHVRGDEVPILHGIIRDIFTGEALDQASLMRSAEALPRHDISPQIQAFAARKGVPPDGLLAQATQLDGLLTRATAVVLLGEAGCGKTTVWKALAEALSAESSVLSPKSAGGLLSSEHEGAMRDGPLPNLLHGAKHSDLRWLVLDGYLDGWVETLHDVLDASTTTKPRRLHLPHSNESIFVDTERVKFIIECDTLKHASPATIARVAVCTLTCQQLATPWHPRISSMKGLPQDLRSHLRGLCDTYLPVAELRVRQRQTKAAGLAAVETALRLIEALLADGKRPEIAFVQAAAPGQVADQIDTVRLEAVANFAFVHAFGGPLASDADRNEFDAWWRASWRHAPMPTAGSVFDFVVDARGNFVPWLVPHTLSTGTDLRSCWIPNVESTRALVLAELLQDSGPVLMQGGPGGGKTTVVKQLPAICEHRSYVYRACNSITDASQLNSSMRDELALDGGTLQPRRTSSSLVLVIDDLHAPQPDTSGVQSAVALLRHLLEHSQMGEFEVRGVQLLAVVGSHRAAGTRRCDRFLRHFATLGVVGPGEDELVALFEPRVADHFAELASTQRTARQLVSATAELHRQMAQMPVGGRVVGGRAFTGHEFSAVLHGMTRTSVAAFSLPVQLCSLWLQEASHVYKARLVAAEDRKSFDVAIKRILQAQCLDNVDLKRAFQPQLFVPTAEATAGTQVAACRLQTAAAPAVRSLVRRCIAEHDEHKDGRGYHTDLADLALFPEALERCLSVARSLSLPSGHFIIAGPGATGKQTSCILGARMCGFTDIVDLTDAAGESEACLATAMKAACMRAGLQDGDGCVCLFHGDLPGFALGMLDDVASTGGVAQNFDDFDLSEIHSTVKAVLSERGAIADKHACLAHFHRQVSLKLHFVLCTEQDVSGFPSLLARCGSRYVEAWSADQLELVAHQRIAAWFRSGAPTCGMSEYEVAISHSFARGHMFAMELSRDGRQYQITPKTLRDCVALCEQLVNQRVEQAQEEQRRRAGALRTIGYVERHQEEVQAQLSATLLEQQSKAEAMEDIEQKIELETERRAHTTEELRLQRDTCEPLVAAAAKEARTYDLLNHQATAALSAIELALQDITKMALTELASMVSPRKELLDAAVAVVMLMSQEENEPDISWTAMKKRFVESEKFRHDLGAVDYDRIPENSVRTVTEYLSSPRFDAEYLAAKSKGNSKAAAGFCAWVRGALTYKAVRYDMREQHHAVEATKASKKIAVSDLNRLTAHAEAMDVRLAVLTKELDYISKELVQSEEQVKKLQAEKRQAEKLLACTSGPASEWRSSIAADAEPAGQDMQSVDRQHFNRFDSDNTGGLCREEIQAMLTEVGLSVDEAFLDAMMNRFDSDDSGSVEFAEFQEMWKLISLEATASTEAAKPDDTVVDCTVGDCMVCAASVLYGAALAAPSRAELRSFWVRDMRTRGVPCSGDGYDWVSAAIPRARIAEWVNKGLSPDASSLENAAACAITNRFPLLIDPDGLAESWLLAMHGVQLRVCHAKDDDVFGQIARWDPSSPLVVECTTMSAKDAREILSGLNAFRQIADGKSDSVFCPPVFLHYRDANPRVPISLAEVTTTILFEHSVTIEGWVLGMCAAMSARRTNSGDARDERRLSPRMIVASAKAEEEEKLDSLVGALLDMDGMDMSRVLGAEGSITHVASAAADWEYTVGLSKEAEAEADALTSVRCHFNDLAVRIAAIFLVWQDMKKLGYPTESQAFIQAAHDALRDCWPEGEDPPVVKLASDVTRALLVELLRPFSDTHVRLFIASGAFRRCTNEDLIERVGQLQAGDDIVVALEELTLKSDVGWVGDVPEIAPSRPGAGFRRTLRQCLQRSELLAAPTHEPSESEEATMRVCWLHAVLLCRASFSTAAGAEAFCWEDLDAALDAATQCASGGLVQNNADAHRSEHHEELRGNQQHKEADHETQYDWDQLITLVGTIYAARIQNRWARRICSTYVREILEARASAPVLPLPQLPVREQPAAAGAITSEAYVDALCPVHEDSTLIGLHGSVVNRAMDHTEEDMFAWRTIAGISAPPIDADERTATIKSSLDDLLDALPAAVPVEGRWLQTEHDAFWPVAEAVKREMACYTRMRDRAKALLHELDACLEAGGNAPMESELEELAEALAAQCVPQGWFCSAEPGGCSEHYSDVLPMACAQAEHTIRDWVSTMHRSLEQLCAWHAALCAGSPSASPASAPFATLWLGGIFEPAGFLSATRQALAREQGWPLHQTCWRAEVPADAGAPTQPSSEAQQRGSVLIEGLRLHGAAWDQATGLTRSEGADGGTDGAEMPAVRLSLRLLRPGAEPEPEGRGEAYACPVFKAGEALITVPLRGSERPAAWVLAGAMLTC